MDHADYPREMLTMVVMGIVFVAIPLWDQLDRWNMKRNGIEVDAVVVRTEEKSDDEGGWSYFPVFQYRIEDVQFETRYTTGNTAPKFETGTHVLIYCHQKKPKKIMVPKDTTRMVIKTIFFTVGILFIFFGTVAGK